MTEKLLTGTLSLNTTNQLLHPHRCCHDIYCFVLISRQLINEFQCFQIISYHFKNIRIFNGCEVLIENSVTRVTVRHHEACLVMPNSYPSDGVFNLHRRTIMDSFSCVLFIRQLHLDLNICCFINFTLA